MLLNSVANNTRLLLLGTMENKQEQEKYVYVLSIKDNQHQRMIQLTEKKYSLGRSPQSAIIIHGNQVSRYHATIIRTKSNIGNSDNFFILDGDLQGNKSTNGLLINNTYKVSHQLKHGDIIYLGYHSTYGEKTELRYFQLSTTMVEHFLKSGQQMDESKLSGILARKESYEETIIT